MTNTLTRSDATKILWEMTYPYALGVVAGALAGWRLDRFPYGFRDMLNASMVFGSIAAGVLATALSLLYTIGRNSVLDAMEAARQRGVGDYKGALVGFLLDAVRFSLLLALASGAMLAIQVEPVQSWHRYVFAAWIALVTATVLLVYRGISLVALLLSGTK